MPYRSDVDAFAQSEAALERELQSLLGPNARHARAERITELERQLERLRACDRQNARRRLPLLERVRIASPCVASWDSMPGNDRVRHCGTCKRSVYDFSALSSAEAEQLLVETEGKLCARVYRRWDGSILTSDCPARRQGKLKLAAAGAASFVALTAGAIAEPELMSTGFGGVSIEDRGGSFQRNVRVTWDYELHEVPIDLGASQPSSD